MKTYDIWFSDDDNSNNKGFRSSFAWCMDWVSIHSATRTGGFEDYKGELVCITCNETGENRYTAEIPI